MNSFKPNCRFFSSDRIVWKNVFCANKYSIPELSDSDAVIDIGAHTGAFACLCLLQGSRRIVAFEPDPESFELAAGNVQAFQKFSGTPTGVELRNLAVWRSDRAQRVRLTHPAYSHLLQTRHPAGQCTLFRDKNTFPVASLGLDSILNPFSEVAVLKVSCEGAEWPILLTAKLLHKVRLLIVQVHSPRLKAHELGRQTIAVFRREFGSKTIEDLEQHLAKSGLRCSNIRSDWRLNTLPDHFSAMAVFERVQLPAPWDGSLNSRIHWDAGGKQSIPIHTVPRPALGTSVRQSIPTFHKPQAGVL